MCIGNATKLHIKGKNEIPMDDRLDENRELFRFFL